MAEPEIIQRTESATDTTQDIAALKSRLKEAEETIRHRDNEIKNLQSNVDVLVARVRKLAVSIPSAKPESVSNGAQQAPESADNKFAALEAKIRELQEVVHGKETIIKSLQQTFFTERQQVESHIRAKESQLLEREREADELRAQLKTVLTRIQELSSCLKQAEALATIDLKDASSNDVPPTPESDDHATVAPAVFSEIVRELTQLIGPIAIVVVRHDVAALGESIETFPRKRLPELLASVTNDVVDDQLKRVFYERFGVDALLER